MNFIQEITEKYNGEYIEFDKREFHTPAGKYVTQLQKGIIKIDRIKFSISQNKSIGVNFYGANKIINDPIHIFLHLKTNEKKLNIYPKNIFQKVISFLSIRGTNNQFEFKGKNDIVERLKRNQELKEKLKNENLYISINEKYPNKIMMTPQNGIENIPIFGKYIEILKIIENKIKNCT